MADTRALTVEDRMAINDLFAAYAWSFDTGEVEAFVACFTPDGALIEEVFEDPDCWEGQDAIRRCAEHYRALKDFPGRQHHISQTQLTGEGERCNARSFVFVTECRGEPPYTLRFAGYYLDRLVKTEAGWRFQERKIRLWDGEVLKNFPGRGEWVARKRPAQMRWEST